MTQLRDFLGGLAHLKMPLRWRIVLLLASAEADQHGVFASQRELCRLLGRPHTRDVRRELEWLVEARLLERVRLGGSAPDLYALRPAEDWLEPYWATSRQDALHSVAFVRDCRARQRDVFAQENSGALGTFARRPARRGSWRLRAGDSLRANGADRAVPTGAQMDGDGAPHSSPRGRDIDLSLTEGGRERFDALKAAVERRCGVTLVGRPVRWLGRIATEANGRFDLVLRSAGHPSGPDRFMARIGWLEDVMLGRAEAPDGGLAAKSGRLQALEQSLAGAIAAGDEELAEELRSEIAQESPA